MALHPSHDSCIALRLVEAQTARRVVAAASHACAPHRDATMLVPAGSVTWDEMLQALYPKVAKAKKAGKARIIRTSPPLLGQRHLPWPLLSALCTRPTLFS